ncbi:putative lipase 8 precursor [Aspergillus steynii IBT 23096]|uniref:Putative lipase 8 n=1 Tax=Aspergillus steynii IBT 23096 TaxID=1392250 RepID=A0A2I2GRQ0_9EURO|nr:putative lipase 8 precursor [Aspergillus steynii IBT 23096]PLB55543.1 putative lipase 8 precursor [Aspergillus steynii IBT 23096]
MLYTALILFGVIGQLLALSLPARNTPIYRGPPILPNEDPFYKPKNASWESSTPGSIIGYRNVNVGSTLIDLILIHSAYQLLYRTTNAHGNPSYAVTTVIIPFNARNDKLLSYQIAYDSPDNNCSPSYWVQEGVLSYRWEIFGELGTLIQTFLAQGVPISIPDYEGVNAAFTVGTQSGYTVLDSVRAVTRSGSITGISPNAQTAIVGYSGGALASEWASELHSVYAPNVRIAGAAMGGLPTNITKTFFAIDRTLSAGLISASFNGIANTFPCFSAYIDQHLLPDHAETFYSTKCQCTNGTRGGLAPYANQSIIPYFDNGDRIVYDQEALLNSIGTMGLHGVPDFPMYIWKGTRDEVAVPIEDTDALVKKYCAKGTNITYVKVENGNHLQSRVVGLPGAEAFLRGIFGGQVPDKCTTMTIPLIPL